MENENHDKKVELIIDIHKVEDNMSEDTNEDTEPYSDFENTELSDWSLLSKVHSFFKDGKGMEVDCAIVLYVCIPKYTSRKI